MTDSSSGGAAAAPAPPPPPAFSPSTSILPFHRQILEELSQQDGLVIVARGLGLPQLLYHLIAHFASTSHLVFVLNLTEDQQRHINERLSTHTPTPSPSSSSSPPPPTPHLHLINNHIPVSERQKLYLTGGVLSITNRILIVDLLNRVISPDLISGLILNAAHRCTDESSEGFILRIFRQSNRHGFIKAFSDEPHTLASGFFGLDKIMKALHLRSLALYPRFHLAVQASLSSAAAASPDVHEMYQPLTPAMDLIQRALIECIDLCLSALKQENKLGASILNVSIDTGLTTAFDVIVRRELDPIWHKVSPRSRQLVADLAALRQCIGYLINYDAVTFYRYLLTVRAQCQASNYSMWLLTEPADRLFKQAKSRVYHFESAAVKKAQQQQQQASAILARARAPSASEQRREKKRKSSAQGKGAKRRSRGGTPPVEVVVVEDDEVEEVKEVQVEETKEEATEPHDQIRLVLEENPKWMLLIDILQEIEEEVKAAKEEQRMKKETTEKREDEAEKVTKAGRVLICCHDDRTCSLLKRYLEEGGRKMMKQLWRSFLFKQRQRKPHPSTASFPASAGVSVTNSPPAHSPPSTNTAATPSPWALMAAETLTLRRELDRVLQRRREARLKKFERERQRRMQREAEEKRRTEIGHDQVTLTQHVRGVEDKKRKEEVEAKRKVTTEKEKERKRKAEQKEKQRRLAKLARDEDDDDGILRDVLLMRDKRQKRIEDLSDEEEEEEGVNEAEEEDAAEKKKKEEDWGVLSVCDVALHLRSNQADDDSVPSTQSSSSAPPPPTASTDVYHDFDESLLHALPEFQLVFHPSADVELMMYRYQPHYIVMFDPDLTLLREVEVYSAYHPHLPVTVYYAQYTNSVEEQKYLSSIKHEKDAFDQLIFQKQHLVVPSEIEGKSVGLSGGELTVERTQAMRMPRGEVDDGSGVRFSTFEAYQSTLKSKGTAVNTRRGGDVSVQVTGRVIVDVREFRSSLPSLLHSRGLTIVPVTLEVGDYVLSPHICVERKSLSDLFSSFLSGRLLKQMEVMCRHYKSPVLLIEFDRKRPFALLSKGELGSEINSRHIMAKIAILCIHFPQVRFVWSRDSHSTSSTFLMLKKNQFEPDVDAALLSSGGEGGVGGTVSVQGMLGGGEEDDERVFAMMSYDMLRKLPGVNASNLRLLVENVGSLRELCDKKLQELMLWMGESNARKLYHFLHNDFSAQFT